LVQVREGSAAVGINVATLGSEELIVSIAVLSGCTGGGYAPRFVGFMIDGDAMAANIERAPTKGTCLTFRTTTFDVDIEVAKLPYQVRRFTFGGSACGPGDEPCQAVSAPRPNAPPSVEPPGPGPSG
jgi:hypothetical protein